MATATEDGGEMKRCSRCHKSKPLEEMRSNGHCKKCGKIYDRERLAAKASATASTVKTYVKRGRKLKANSAHVPLEMADDAPPMVVHMFYLKITDSGGDAHEFAIAAAVARRLLGELREVLE